MNKDFHRQNEFNWENGKRPIPKEENERLLNNLREALRRDGFLMDLDESQELHESILERQNGKCIFGCVEMDQCWTKNRPPIKLPGKKLYAPLEVMHLLPAGSCDPFPENYGYGCNRCNNQLMSGRTPMQLATELRRKLPIIERVAQWISSKANLSDLEE